MPRKVLVVSEVADLFRVHPKAVVRWCNDGKLPHFATLGGHRRFYEDEILPLLTSETAGQRVSEIV